MQYLQTNFLSQTVQNYPLLARYTSVKFVLKKLQEEVEINKEIDQTHIF